MSDSIKIAVHTERYFHIVLKEDQVRWLMSYIKSPIYDEDVLDREHRQGLFKSLDEALNSPEEKTDGRME